MLERQRKNEILIKKGKCKIEGPCSSQKDCCPGYDCHGDVERYAWCDRADLFEKPY